MVLFWNYVVKAVDFSSISHFLPSLKNFKTLTQVRLNRSTVVWWAADLLVQRIGDLVNVCRWVGSCHDHFRGVHVDSGCTESTWQGTKLKKYYGETLNLSIKKRKKICNFVNLPNFFWNFEEFFWRVSSVYLFSKKKTTMKLSPLSLFSRKRMTGIGPAIANRDWFCHDIDPIPGWLLGLSISYGRTLPSLYVYTEQVNSNRQINCW